MTYQTVGKTVLGNDILMFKIGNLEGGRVLFDGALHGTEAMGSELLYSYAEWLLESNDAVANDILRTTCTLLIPVVNADKENYARKNANGVDLNRNFATSWSSSGSIDSSSDKYRGPYALSEPESQTLVTVFNALKPTFYVNLHMWAGPYYAGCRYANATYYSVLVSRIANLSRARGISPFPYHGEFGGAGMAIADAARVGITSFLIELTENVVPLSEVQTTLLRKFLPVATILSQEAKPPTGSDHDVAVIGATSSKTVVGKGSTLLIEAKVADLGLNPEDFNLTVSVNNTLLAETVLSLLPGEIRSFTTTWNTSTALYGKYTVSVYAKPVANETETSNNLIKINRLTVTIPGDVRGDYSVDIFDALALANSYGKALGSSDWNSNADINSDNVVSVYDAIILATNYG